VARRGVRVVGGFGTLDNAVTTHAWTPGHFRLFITHVDARRAVAGELRDGLRPFDIDAFVAHESIAATTPWQDEIEDALLTRHACVAILSDGFNESNWCDQEVGVCFGRGVLVLSISDGLSPYGFIGKFQAFNPRRYGDPNEMCQAIYELLRDNKRARTAMAGALVHRFENSDSYAEARDNVDRLKTVPPEAWTPDLLDRIERAHEFNRQIAEADYHFQHLVPVEARNFVNSIRSF
jgi:TIR domain